MDTVRVFIAVDVGDEIRGRLEELQRKLRKVHSNVRWTGPGAIHLTLAFMGNVPVEELDRITSALALACRGVEAFAMEAAGTGTFGKPKHPRVIWAGIADCPPLMELQHRIGEALLAAGTAFDRKPFSPHITLGRVKSVDHHTTSLLDKLEKHRSADLGQTRVATVELIKSELTPHGAEYTVLHRVELMEGYAVPEPGGDGASPSVT